MVLVVRKDIRAAVEHLDPPLAVLDLDAARDNARAMSMRAAGTPIRVASKSLRIRALISDVLSLPGFQGILAYSLPEALWLHATGTADDILVAYPTTHRAGLAELCSNPAAREAITLMVDSPEHVDLIAAYATAPVRVCIDVDASLKYGPVHIGARRSPIHSADAVVELATTITRHPAVQLVGLMAYEGQIAGTTDSSPAIVAMKRLSAAELARRRARIVAAVQDACGPLEFVNGGGTGSIETTTAEEAITEIGAGSGILGSGLFDRYTTFQSTPAQWFVVPVTRKPTPHMVTVSGGGRVASGPINPDRLPTVDWPAGLTMTALEGPGEVQTPLAGPAARNLQLGDHVWMRHAKAGEANEFTADVVVVSGGEILATWPTYRGEGKAFV
ncbi:MAG TPA: alanine racemase [Candidatus Corynebacterium gallistercoris]|uniref:Alanine racemase n=1 Tax=Candidatus Corynebacterium gallistercoris TaxID=2838530 RepID=A0A9D1UQJ0_9CORY|nr:alanine racemase [Candidatus Corynebacterium gallistercoris]